MDTRDYLTANLRELTRIAFFLRHRALLRLIAYAGIARRLEKCWGKTGVPVFLFVTFSFLCNWKYNETTEKPAGGFFR
ncbi:hypothetical protein [Methanocorpusculum labreanum]|uniref:hypothetical protein n=1 Tax=Methanocorpusculum labreanum TaxID=83984 RepID=UPI0003251B51|nr:hypothetical protein [Methanocorpusculum labreanum]